MEHKIRILNAGDANAFIALRINSLKIDPLSWHSSLKEEKDLPENNFINKIIGSIYPPIFGYYGYFENDNLLAYALISPNFYNKKRHIANIYDVAVAKEARRKSVGSKLINHIIEKAKHIGFIEQIHLKVNSENKGAINFYEKLGFKKVSTLKDAVKESDGSYQDEYEYVFKIKN